MYFCIAGIDFASFTDCGIFAFFIFIKGRSPYNGKLSDFSSILIAKYLFTGSLKNRSIDNLET